MVLDFGSQYSQLITRRVREAGVYSELVPFDAPWSRWQRSIRPASSSPAGRPASTNRARPSCRAWLWDADLPVLGICYGMQLLAHELGGKVDRRGQARVRPGHDRRPTADRRSSPDCREQHRRLDEPWRPCRGHAARLRRIGDERQLARSRAMSKGQMSSAIQFHPEVVHTPLGQQIISNFLNNICGCRRLDVGDPSSTSAVARDPRAGRRRPGDLRALAAGSIPRSRRR